MRKKFFSVVSLFFLFEAVQAQTVAVADVEALPGETVEFSLNLSGGRADSYTALSFDVQFPAEGFTTTGAYNVSDSWKGTMASIGDVDATGLATIPFASSNAIAGTDVENLVSISFKVAESIATGVYDVTLKNIMFEYGVSDKDYAAAVTFHVNVLNKVTLDENSLETPKPHSGVDVHVLRTIKANEWSTICLPFAMSNSQCKAAFGDDVLLGDFNGYQTTENGNAVTGVTVKFSDATTIEANHPYIIKVSKPVSEFTVDGVDINPQVAEINKGTSRKPKSFIGNYIADTNVDYGCLFLSDNKFWYSVGATKIKAFRAYFNFFDLLTNFEENYAEAPIFIMFDNVTGIDNVKHETIVDDCYYNLNGQRVGHPSNGLYIQKGKKMIIKRNR